jgi:hypothetical protein
MMFPSFLKSALRQSGNLSQLIINFRPITLRHQVSLVLPFGQPVDHSPQKVLTLDARHLHRRLSKRLSLYR